MSKMGEISAILKFLGPQLTESQLQAFERMKHVNLPADYRDFLLQANGCVPVPNTFPFRWGNADAYAHTGRFFGIDHPAAMYNLAKGWPAQQRIASRFLIIAMDYTDSLFNLVCIVIEGDEFGFVYYLPQYPQYDLNGKPAPKGHEEFDTDYPLSFFVAETFTEFLNLLTEPPSGLFKEGIAW